jgi:hypothetical protein
VISEYLDTLATALNFDRALARTVRDEVEDHLREAVAADRVLAGIEAERRAIASFGDPYVLAAQFAAIALAKQSRKIAVAVLLVLVALFVSMKTRLAWYALTQWTIAEDMKPIGNVVVTIDRYAFWLSVIGAIGCWAYISSRRIPVTFDRQFRNQLRTFFFLCAASICALFVSVAGDGILTMFWLLGREWSLNIVIPIASMTIEIACACLLALQVRDAVAKVSLAAPLTNIQMRMKRP